MFHKVNENGAIGQNTYDILVFCGNFGRISYCFGAVDFMPK